ncbi:MAG: hypothetical protein GC178_01390 [Flavobacteriales bacterium]|nr:hypothetical protein [Flavobacteriales bacterium]
MKKHGYILLLVPLYFGCNEDNPLPDVISLDSLKQTEFVLTIEQPVDLQKTQIYCSTGEYAWNQVKQIINRPLTIPEAHSQLMWLNEATSFENSISDNEIDVAATVDETLISVTAVFKKSLPFAKKFKRNHSELVFKNTVVESLGAMVMMRN